MQLTEYKIYCKIKLPIMYRMIVLKIKMIFKILCGILFSVLLIANMCCCNFVDGIIFYESISQTSSEQTEPSTQPAKKRDVDTSYGYKHLSSESLKNVYVMIDEYVEDLNEDSIYIEEILSEMMLCEVIEAYRNDHPEVFWLTSNFEYVVSYSSTFLYLDYSVEADEFDDMKAKFDKTVQSAVESAPQNASQYELELYANDYIVDNCEYDYEAVETEGIINNENDAYGVFVDKKAVCEGYARAFQLLCNRLGIDCVSVTGEGDGEPHQWNCALIDGEWYCVDVTWNDSSEDCQFPNYNYFNLPADKFSELHKPAPLYSEISYDEYAESNSYYNVFVPECDGEKYYYYSYSCVTFDDYSDGAEIAESIAKAAADGEEYYRFVIGDELDFVSTADDIVYNGYIYEWISNANFTNGYDPELNGECYVYYDEEFRVIIVELDYI